MNFRDDFIKSIAPFAMKEQYRTGVLASITLAQAILESGWGEHAPGNNLFGIKGTGLESVTQEYENGHFVTIMAGFRVYDSWQGSVIDHSNFLLVNGRYAKFLRCCLAMDWQAAADALQLAGYATDPKYAALIRQIITVNELWKYDYEGVDEVPKLPPWIANTIIDTWLKPAYDEAMMWSDYEGMGDAHLLANALREASGQELT